MTLLRFLALHRLTFFRPTVYRSGFFLSHNKPPWFSGIIGHQWPIGNKKRMKYLSNLVPAHVEKNIEKYLRRLTPREEMVLRVIYGIGEQHCTVAETAAKFVVTRSRIYQIYNKAIRKLNDRRRNRDLDARTEE